jgi:predicted acylesterase/phospholipase RssA
VAPAELSAGQRLGLEQLEALAATGDAVEILDVADEFDSIGRLSVTISVRCSGMARQPGGLDIRARERFTIAIPDGFPFEEPSVGVLHQRWAGNPHVQWATVLCLYQTRSEWDPADGMTGLIDRLHTWLERGAAGELDAIGGPLHPPAVYKRDWSLPLVIPRADTPEVNGSPWLGVAELNPVSPRRLDVVGWHDALAPWPQTGALAILLPEPLSWEFPTTVREMVVEFERQGVPRPLLLNLFRLGALALADGEPLYVVVGSPMRGIAGGELKQHLEVWHISDVIAKGLRLSVERFSDDEKLREIGEEVEQIILGWADKASLAFCPVSEARPEVTERRDDGSPLEWFRGKTVALWGCGALGGWCAEVLTRAGVARLILYDNDIVSLGVLVRQPYEDVDVGQWKALQLAERIRRIRPDVVVDVKARDVTKTALAASDWSDGSDVVIDATASVVVATKLEKVRSANPRPIPIIAMLLGHRAERGLLAVARAEYSGATHDVVRKAKLACVGRPELGGFLDEFWPSPPRKDIFQPEPGCSESTFRGGAAEVIGLAALMLDAAARELGEAGESAVAHLIALPAAEHDGRRQTRLAWSSDTVLGDGLGNYEVRLARAALAEIQGWSRRAARVLGPQVETGGLLFGQRDDAAGVVWVSEATGPPPDSTQSEIEFVCGTEGNDRYREEKERRGRGSLGFLGMWHTHPGGVALPSERDILSMTRLVLAEEPPMPKSLALIVGATADEPEIGAYVFDRSQYGSDYSVLVFRDTREQPEPPSTQGRDVGLALSGGGSRAIAFQLGCLRALHDRGMLGRVAVVSGVSGGSVMAAAWAYSDDDFPEFDRRIVDLLRRGITSAMTRRVVAGRAGLAAAATMATAGVAAAASRTLNAVGDAAGHMPGVPRQRAAGLHREPPLRRFASRTDALADALDSELFDGAELTSPRRGAVDVVINACDLRSGSAFRFGSRESSCSRYGTIKGNNVRVAEAVAASAAYPVFLPALDREWAFVRRDGGVFRQRVVLTDGGVYDNLGTTCLEPGRSPDHTYNVFAVDYIVACDAGRGILAADPIPYFWVSRMKRSFESVFRKAQDGTRARLHEYAASGRLAGFVLPYLGNQDRALPVQPADLVPRETVVDYPTDFSAMSEDDVERLALRGEQLTRLLIDHYCPEL